MNAALLSLPLAGRIAASSGQWPLVDGSEALVRRLNNWRCHGLAVLIHAAARLLLVAAVCSALPASAEVIQDVVSVSSGVVTQDDWEIRYRQPNGDGTGHLLTLARTSSPDPAIEITPEDHVLGIVFSWYEASEDDVFDGSVVENLTPFAAPWGVCTPIAVPAEVPLFLTSWSGMGFDQEHRRRGRPSKPAARASREGMRPEQMQPVLGDLPTGGIGPATRLLRSWAGEGRSRR